MAILTKAQLEALNQSSFPDQSTEAITPAILRNYNTQTIDTLVDSLDTGSFTTDAEFNAFTSSTNSSITQLNAATASLNSSASLALVTASFSGNTLTFTKGNGTTFGVVIPDVSGSTGNFATTGSNVFVGNQTISGSLFVSGSEVITGTLSASALRVENNTHLDGQLRVTNDAQFDGHILIQGASPHLKLRDTSGGGGSAGYDVRVDTGSFEIHDDTHNRNVLSDIFNPSTSKHTTSLTSEVIVISGSTSLTLIGNVSASIISASTINGLGDPLAFSASVDSRINAITSSGGIPAGTISGSAQITSLGFVSSSVTASSLVTASFSGNTLTFTKGDSSTFGVVIPDISGSTINTGSFATTGSNTFTGKQIIDGYQNGIALTSSLSYIDLVGPLSHISLYSGTGSIRFYTGSATGTGNSDIDTYVNMQVNPANGALAISQFPYNNHFVDFDVATTSSIFTAPIKLADTTTFGTQTIMLSKSGSLMFIANALDTTVTNISASTNTQLNLILKTANNQSASLTISGSNNLIGLATAPTTGFKRYLTSNNIALGGNLPQITGSANYSPSISANFLNGELTFRGAASSSAWTISNNILQNAALRIGSGDSTSANQAIAGGTMGSNILLSTVNYNAYTTPLVVAANFNRNLAVGTDTTLTAFSSSITSNSNIFNGQTFAVNNSYFGTASTAAAQRLQLSFNVLGGINSSILTASGSNTTTSVAREAIANTTNGSGLALGVVLNGDNSSLLSTLVHGSNLTVTGSSANNNYTTAGGAFIGRNNSVNGTAARSGETIFAVGTGTSTSVRKTGFLIDSGSNTFIEGTLNVSGSTSFNGAVNITGSAPTILSSSFSGSLITNLTDIYTDVPSVNQIVTLTSASYAGLVSGSLVDPNTLYVVSGSTPIGATLGSNTFSGSQIFTGSVIGNVVNLSISSNTASMDLNNGNYFTLTLADTSTTHITATNIKPGTSATLVITTGTNSSASLAPILLQPSGSSYSATLGSAKKDVLSLVAVGTTSAFVVSTKNMI